MKKKIIKKNMIIGALHFPPLLGYEKFPGFDLAKKNALEDLKAFNDASFDAVIIENNYDDPHFINVDTSVAVAMTALGIEIRKNIDLPLGVSVLWNDYKTALSIAKAIDAQFIRIPVFVDTVEASCGIIKGEYEKILAFRSAINADHILLFTDIHVKHSKLLSTLSLSESAQLAVQSGSDALIVTGNWTGQPPTTDDIKLIRSAVGDFPIVAGSGISSQNIKDLFQHCDGCIVSTSLKEGVENSQEINVKGYDQRINAEKCIELKKVVSNLHEIK